MELPKEQYEYQKTLADIGVQIGIGRAELADLAKKKEDFMAQQEAEAIVRIQAILDASTEALNLVGKNQVELEGYHNELRSFATELVSWNEKLTKQQQEFEVRSTNFWNEVGRKTKELETLSTTLRMQESRIATDRLEQHKKDLELTKKERQVNDKYNTLLRTEGRLNK